MTWISQLAATSPIAHAIGILSLVCVAGMAVGSVKARGIGLGTSGVLFAGLAVGHFSKPVDHTTLDFVKEFGLILFVFTIGLQLGPGFFAALRKDGIPLNALAAGIVLLGTLFAVALGWLLEMDAAAMVGLLAGATTNTPALGAAQQTLSTLPGVSPERAALPALAYAVSYPAAIAGILGAMLALVATFRVDAVKEAEALAAARHRHVPRHDETSLAAGHVGFRRLVVTRRAVLGRTIEELAFDASGAGIISRVTRADLDLAVTPDLRLQFGDMVRVVGDPAALDTAEKLLGNSVKELNTTHFIPFFIGIALGIALGTLPIAVPGLPQPVRLGLAGGPLIVALILGRFGRIGRLVCHMPVNANLAFREFGIALFFAAVGLAAGPTFFASVFSANGLTWLMAGLVITVVPLVVGGVIARAVLNMNFTVLSGLLAGSVTDPPALAFANNLARSDAPTVAYATVYPMTTLLRILVAQVLTLILAA